MRYAQLSIYFSTSRIVPLLLSVYSFLPYKRIGTVLAKSRAFMYCNRRHYCHADGFFHLMQTFARRKSDCQKPDLCNGRFLALARSRRSPGCIACADAALCRLVMRDAAARFCSHAGEKYRRRDPSFGAGNSSFNNAQKRCRLKFFGCDAQTLQVWCWKIPAARLAKASEIKLSIPPNSRRRENQLRFLPTPNWNVLIFVRSLITYNRCLRCCSSQTPYIALLTSCSNRMCHWLFSYGESCPSVQYQN